MQSFVQIVCTMCIQKVRGNASQRPHLVSAWSRPCDCTCRTQNEPYTEIDIVSLTEKKEGKRDTRKTTKTQRGLITARILSEKYRDHAAASHSSI